MKTLKNYILSAMGILALASCTGEDPVYWFEQESSAGGSASDVLYFPASPSSGNLDGDYSDSYAPDGYKIAWSDEFDTSVTLYTNWLFNQGGTGWGNHELQYYCPNGYYSESQRTAIVSDGTLKIKAYKVNPSPQTDNCPYVSARMDTKQGFKYGYIEMRAKLPVTPGVWPAFWMLLKDGPSYVRDASKTGAEIDMMEYVPNDGADQIYFSAHSYNATLEAGRETGYVDPVTGQKYSYCQAGTNTTPDDWHCYGMEWTHEYIKGFIDGVQYFYAPNPTPDAKNMAVWPFDQEFYIKLNLAIGGDWGGTVDPNLTEETFEVDWVRVFQRDETPAPTNPVKDKLTATQWTLTGVKEGAVDVTTSAGNKLTLKSDGKMEFDCTANDGKTFDHTWEGTLIAPNTYGEVNTMSWNTYSEDGKNYLKVNSGFLLVFVQDDTAGTYEITELTDKKLTVAITTYDEVWTLTFTAAAKELTLAEKLTSTQWTLTGVKEGAVDVTTSAGNKLTLKSDGKMEFDCTANSGKTFDHTWEGTLIAPDTYGEVNAMAWTCYTDSSTQKDYLKVTSGFLLVFVQEGDTGTYEITELTDTTLKVAITTYEEVWTLTFTAATE